jgi:hypothetical protein
MNLQSSTLKFDETGEPFHIQQAAQIRAFRAAWKEAGHPRILRVSVSRSIFALIDDRDRAYFRRSGQEEDKIGLIDQPRRRSLVAAMLLNRTSSSNNLGKMRRSLKPIRSLLTVPNQQGVAYNAHVLEAILTTVAPALGWR